MKKVKCQKCQKPRWARMRKDATNAPAEPQCLRCRRRGEPKQAPPKQKVKVFGEMTRIVERKKKEGPEEKRR